MKGGEKFKGKTLHSQDVRIFDEFKDKNVLVIGGGPSAEDIAVQCYKFGSKRVIWAPRRLRIGWRTTNFPQNMEIILGFDHVDE